MFAFVVRRLLIAIPILLLSSFLVFLLVVASGDPLEDLRLRPGIQQSVIDARESELGLNKAIPARYWDWLTNFVRGDFGKNLKGQEVQPQITRALGLTMRLGRPFSKEEDQPGHDNVVILNERFWKSRFNGDSGIIGRSVRLNAVEHVVIGVISPAADVMTADANIWVPIAFTTEERADSRKGYLDVFGRLAPDCRSRRHRARCRQSRSLSRRSWRKIVRTASASRRSRRSTSVPTGHGSSFCSAPWRLCCSSRA